MWSSGSLCFNPWISLEKMRSKRKQNQRNDDEEWENLLRERDRGRFGVDMMREKMSVWRINLWWKEWELEMHKR